MSKDQKTNEIDDGVDIGGQSYLVLFDPNLSVDTRQSIAANINKSSSGNNTDIYDVHSILDAIEQKIISVSDRDIVILNAIHHAHGYIEIS